ncbi:MAG: helix-turn-helix transcriptional regulator [Elusimicrobia bacterium]|nr:helix-turn-helix transcriptional regulator [Elusimicrobiota bacterium]
MLPLRLLREARGFSQRRLARRAGIAYKTLQLLESGRHGPRWSTLEKLAKALDLKALDLAQAMERPRQETLRDATARIARDGERSWTAHLLEFTDDFRRRPSAGLVADAPDPRSGPRIMALAASIVERLCALAGIPAPWWCAGVPPLADPWFTAGAESLKVSALVESPAQFRQRNIFVLGNFLSRA